VNVSAADGGAAAKGATFAAATLAFGAGAGVLALEITAARVFQPWFGSSIVVWSNVIGVTLGAVAAGNFLGGRIADRVERSAVLGWLFISAGILAACFPHLAPALASRYLPNDLPLDVAFSLLGRASLLVALLTLAPPLVCIGATSPFLVRSLARDGRIGRAAGWIAGAGTLGSLVGTWLPVHFTIPRYGSTATCWLAGGVLVACGMIPMIGRRPIRAAVLILIGAWGSAEFLPRAALHRAVAGDSIAELETRYQYARVERDGTRTVLRLNEGLDSFHSVTIDGEILTDAYYDPFLLLPPLVDREGDTFDIAILGFAAGTWGRQLLATYADRADLRIVGVELDPEVAALGPTHFGLPSDPRLRMVSNQDARIFLDHAEERFEIILVDTYANQIYVPFHTCSQEFFAAARRHLTAKGLLAANLEGVGFDSRPLVAIRNTAASVFDQVAVERFMRGRNFMLLASADGLAPRLCDAAERVANWLQPFARSQCEVGVRREYGYDPNGVTLTDDHSAIEALADADMQQRAEREIRAVRTAPR
jgi:spermidine synthase